MEADDSRRIGSLRTPPRRPPQGSYAGRRDRMIRRARREGVGCRSCLKLAESLLVTGGALERFRYVCRVRRREERRRRLYEAEGHPLRKKVRTREGHLLRVWRLLKVWRIPAHKRDQFDPSLLRAYDRVKDRMGQEEGGFSMRGRGGKRREFEEWAGELPEGDRGRPGLLRTATGDEPDVRACLENLEAWVEHLEKEREPVEHVERVFRPARNKWGDCPLPSERRRVRSLAREVADFVTAHVGDRRRSAPALARGMLADLSEGLLSPDQIGHLVRKGG